MDRKSTKGNHQVQRWNGSTELKSSWWRLRVIPHFRYFPMLESRSFCSEREGKYPVYCSGALWQDSTFSMEIELAAVLLPRQLPGHHCYYNVIFPLYALLRGSQYSDDSVRSFCSIIKQWLHKYYHAVIQLTHRVTLSYTVVRNVEWNKGSESNHGRTV